MNHHVMYEWGFIAHGDGKKGLSKVQAARLAAAADAAHPSKSGDRVLVHEYRGLRARGVVGMVATDDCQLEILPKVDRKAAGVKDEPKTLRGQLIKMLAVAHDLPIDTGNMSQLASRRDALLEVLIQVFCKQVMVAARQGLPRRYIDMSDDLPALRGRLNVTRQFSILAASPQRLACHFDELSPDTALNRVIRAAVDYLLRVARTSDNQRSLRTLLSVDYAEVADVPRRDLPWEHVVIDRTNERWRLPWRLAKLFLHNEHQELGTGDRDGVALLFEMHELFENYVAKVLRPALAGCELVLREQHGGKHCLFQGEEGRFGTRADITLKRGNDIAFVIDTKWKCLEDNQGRRGISQGDIYQLMAYNRVYKCPNVMLLYPWHDGLPADGVRESYDIVRPGSGKKLFVATVNLTNPQTDAKKKPGEDELKEIVAWGLREAAASTTA